MSHQLTLDHAMVRARAEDGMRRALEHAEQTVEKWGDLAYLFLEQYARRHLVIKGEEVTEASKQWGMAQPPDDRAWGSVYQRALRAGVMEKDGYYDRAHGNGSPGPKYRSKIYCVTAT